jgi:glutamine synthetase
MLVMEVLKEALERRGLVGILHEKPFTALNGSGKHGNWSLNYVKKDGSIQNLFKHSKNDTPKEVETYKLFILIQLMAVLKYHRLYLASVAIPGNEIRLGGHEAPPRIFSVFLGEALSSMLDGKEPPAAKNLRDIIPTLCYDAYQENTDRNRTSPFAYTGRLFEFRALGSSQNAAFPMAVVAATMTAEVKETIKLLESGKSVKEIIAIYQKETQKIRFEGNGYSEEWKEEAKRRGLYVNEKFS